MKACEIQSQKSIDLNILSSNTMRIARFFRISPCKVLGEIRIFFAQKNERQDGVETRDY